VTSLNTKLAEAGLFAPKWLAAVGQKLLAGHAMAAEITALSARADTLEDVVRTKESLAGLPGALRTLAAQLVSRTGTLEEYQVAARARVLRAEVLRRLENNPRLKALDSHRLETMFERYAEVDALKKDCVRDQILSLWIGRQKDRLLAGTGTRLNSLGADLRRRLTLRGKNAMRLRQVIAAGEQIEGATRFTIWRPCGWPARKPSPRSSRVCRSLMCSSLMKARSAGWRKPCRSSSAASE